MTADLHFQHLASEILAERDPARQLALLRSTQGNERSSLRATVCVEARRVIETMNSEAATEDGDQ